MASPPAQLAPEGSLRRRAARGTVINAAFNVALQLLGFLKGWIVAGFLTATQYGVWGLLVISLGTLLWLAQIGIDDKYIQQDHPDQEKAFQLAFTLQCMLAGLFMVILAAGMHCSVNASWNAFSWSGWSCWMYLSSMRSRKPQSGLERDDEQSPDAVLGRGQEAATIPALRNPSSWSRR